MIKGILLITITGLFWCGNGIIFSYAARRSLDFIAIMVLATFFGAVFSWLFLTKPQMILDGAVLRLTELTVSMLLSGIIGTIGVILMQKAMRSGHHGIVWTISQFAMIIPFLVGIFFYHAPTTPMKNAGLFCVMISFIAFGMGQPRNHHLNNHPLRFWFPLTIASFLVLGLHQCISLVPSYWQNWVDSANLRGALINTGFSSF